MNKLVCIFLLLFLSHSLANDSTNKSTLFSNITFGLKGGFYSPISSSNYDFREDSDRKDPLISNSLGGILGISAVYDLDENISFGAELQYSTFRFEIRKFGYFREDKINVTEEMIEMPLLFRKSIINNSSSNYGISFGPIVGYKLSNLLNYSLNGETNSYSDKLNTFNLDLFLSINVITDDLLLIDLRYKYALLNDLSENNNLIQSNEKSAYLQYHSIQFSISYLISNYFK